MPSGAAGVFRLVIDFDITPPCFFGRAVHFSFFLIKKVKISWWGLSREPAGNGFSTAFLLLRGSLVLLISKHEANKPRYYLKLQIEPARSRDAIEDAFLCLGCGGGGGGGGGAGGGIRGGGGRCGALFTISIHVTVANCP